MNPDKYTCIIVDDEPKAIELLVDHLATLFKKIEVLGTYTQWDLAWDALQNNEYDLIFLDISMQGKSGLDLLRLLPKTGSEVIFVTAHSDYALDAYKLSASGYILKPIHEPELIATVNNALERVRNKKLAKAATTSLPVLNSKIGIPTSNAIDYINPSEIIYLESVNSYTKVVTTHGDILSSYNIGKFKGILNEDMFFQTHRSYIVNLDRVRRYEVQGVVIMDNNVEISISKNFKDEFLNMFNRLKK
jgi:two-component system LytT family response regulator